MGPHLQLRADELPEAVAASKVDVARENWQVAEEEGREMAERLGAAFYATSALTGEGVNGAVEGLAASILERRRRKEMELQHLMELEQAHAARNGKKNKSGVRAKIARLICHNKGNEQDEP